MKNQLLGGAVNRLTIVAMSICIACNAFAEDTATSLIQACQSLKRQADRNKCLEEAVKSVAARPVPAIVPTPPAVAVPEPSKKEMAAKHAEQVFAAAQALQSVIDLGVSYNDYKPYVQKLAVELGAYKAAVKFPEEQRAVELLQESIDAYEHAREYWYADIEFYARRDNRIAYPDGLPMQMAGVSYIINRYSIPIQNSDWLGLNRGASRGTALSTIWQFAQGKISEAKAVLSFEQVTSDPKTEALAVAERMVIPRVGGAELFRIANAYAGAGKFVCGSVAGKTDSSFRLFAANPEAGSVYIEGEHEWTDAIWPTFCR